ncbi:MAG TPA: RNA methyltransferase, partial [Opitutaceae bacterium]
MSLRRNEQAVCGLAAVSALYARRPEAIRRLFFDEAKARMCGAMSRYLAKRKKIYRQVEAAELEKVSGTVHHGGIVAIAVEPALVAPTEDDVEAWVAEARPVVLLDRIGNAHNLGAIVRTAAFFGVRHLIIPDHPQQAVPSEAAYRVAEGGFEYLTVWCVEDMAVFCKYLRRTFALVGATLNGEPLTSLTREGINGKLLSGRPTALILGNEEDGIAPEIAAVCNRLVRVAGGG